MLRTSCLIAVLLLPGISAAQEAPAQPLQELFLTELVYPQEKGEIQLMLGTRIDRARADQSTLVPFTIEYGLTDRWQLEAGWDGYSRDDGAPFQGLTTARLSIGTKYSLMHIAHSGVHAAFGSDVEFPRAGAFADNEGENGVEIEPFVALAVDLPAHVSIFGSAGASFEPGEAADLIDSGERPDDRGTISAGMLWAWHWATLAAEYTNRSDGLPWRLEGAALLTPSVVVHPHGKWELGVGLPIALRGRHQPGIALNVVKEF
jgi:hypothetical protein